jgi:hypothetical protein
MGLIIGTVIGAMAVVIIALIGLAFFCRRRNRHVPFPRHKWPPSWSGLTGPVTGTVTGTGTTGTGSGTGLHPSELPERYELGDTQVGAELDSNPVQFELYSPQQQRAGYGPVRESWVSGDTDEGTGASGDLIDPMSPMSPMRTRYRDG